jgi:outer membrane protein TolC
MVAAGFVGLVGLALLVGAPVAWAQAPPGTEVPRVGLTPGVQTELTLDELIARVLEQNPAIHAARVDLESAEFAVQMARGLFDPRVTTDWSFERRATPVSSTLGGVTDGRLDEDFTVFGAAVAGAMPWGGGTYSSRWSATRATSNSLYVPLNPQFPSTLSFSLTQPLWRNRAIDAGRRQLQIAQVSRTLTEAQFRQQVADLIAAAAQAYWALVLAVEQLDVQDDALVEAREHVAGNRRMAAQGLLSAIDIVEAEAQVAIFEGGVAAAREAVTRSENAIKALMLPDRTSPLWAHALRPTTAPALAAPGISFEEAIQLALANRPEREALTHAATINEIQTRFFRDQAKPQVDLVGSYTLQGLSGPVASRTPPVDATQVPSFLVGGMGTSLGTLFARDFPSVHVGLSLSLPLWNRSAQAGVAASQADGRRLALQRAQADQAIEAEVRNTIQAVRSADAQLIAAAAGREAAEQQYGSEQRRLSAGLSTVYLLFQRHSALVAARGREWQARAQLSQTLIEYGRVTGTVLDRYGVKVR